jgi:hypothetical protein
MSLDRRSFLISLASSAAMLALPAGATAAPDAECFAAARRDDRGNFSAALFTLNGDLRAVELPQRGHDITLKPDGPEWVAFARRPARVAIRSLRAAGLVRRQARSSLLRPRRVLGRWQAALHDGERL